MGKKYTAFVEEIPQQAPPKQSSGYTKIIAIILLLLAGALWFFWVFESEKPTEGSRTVENGNEVKVVSNDFQSERYKSFVKEETEKYILQTVHDSYHHDKKYFAKSSMEYYIENFRKAVGLSYDENQGYISLETFPYVTGDGSSVQHISGGSYTATVHLKIMEKVNGNCVNTENKTYTVNGHVTTEPVKVLFLFHYYKKKYIVDHMGEGK
ncbi:hypothetical protein [Ectobacillus ponti]|uniref:Uncharacterized protein n=1 Tax=Ectobacillus ponti TaxID=2961894 RepID=A0AA41X9Y2_9BACI|nr:hypothetical protein [Ectobacillus ponti]MCP8968993.1 hypothetical protein [Ectobacillus ponti]